MAWSVGSTPCKSHKDPGTQGGSLLLQELDTEVQLQSLFPLLIGALALPGPCLTFALPGLGLSLPRLSPSLMQPPHLAHP